MRLPIFLSLALSCALTTTAFAKVEVDQYVFKKADLVQDGKLTEREVKLARQELLARMKQSLRVGSGVIEIPSNGFVKSHVLGYSDLMNVAFKTVSTKINSEAIDTDDDGLVTKEEFKAYIEVIQTTYREAVEEQRVVALDRFQAQQAAANAQAAAVAAARANAAANNRADDNDDDRERAADRRERDRERDRERERARAREREQDRAREREQDRRQQQMNRGPVKGGAGPAGGGKQGK